jgi:hypothetical protein
MKQPFEKILEREGMMDGVFSACDRRACVFNVRNKK